MQDNIYPLEREIYATTCVEEATSSALEKLQKKHDRDGNKSLSFSDAFTWSRQHFSQKAATQGDGARDVFVHVIVLLLQVSCCSF